jgi:hypothetical protein
MGGASGNVYTSMHTSTCACPEYTSTLCSVLTSESLYRICVGGGQSWFIDEPRGQINETVFS